MTDFGPLLRARREARAPLSQTALAGQVGCSASLISRLESGGRRPDRDLVRRLADILGLTGAARAEVFLAADYLPDNITDWSYTDEQGDE